MATTPNFSIPLYTTSDTAKLDTLLNGQATAIDTNLKVALLNKGSYQIGTNAQRLALTGGNLFNGLKFYCTDTKIEWLYDGSTWLTITNGLALLSKTTFTSASSVIFDGFTSQFDNYRAVLDIHTSSTSAGGTIQMRSSGINNASANYAAQQQFDRGSSHTAVMQTGLTSFPVVPVAGAEISAEINFFAPQLPRVTRMSVDAQVWVSPTDAAKSTAAGRFNATTAFTGFIYAPSIGTVSGTLTVYGLA